MSQILHAFEQALRSSAIGRRRRLPVLFARALVAGTGLLGFASAAPALAAAAKPVLYVANGQSGSVTAYDLDSGTSAATIPVGTQPQGVAVSPDGKTVYIANAIGGISVIDTASNAVTATIADNSFPIGLALSPDGQTLYAANETGTVSVISTASDTATAHD